jgi:hypothetical protein
MDVSFPAWHKAISGVDLEGLADRRRTNQDQIMMRNGLYHSLRTAFARSGIDWTACYHEDRGDRALILVPPEVPISERERERAGPEGLEAAEPVLLLPVAGTDRLGGGACPERPDGGPRDGRGACPGCAGGDLARRLGWPGWPRH